MLQSYFMLMLLLKGEATEGARRERKETVSGEREGGGRKHSRWGARRQNDTVAKRTVTLEFFI